MLNLTTGEIVPGRCRATNLCAYCRTLYTVETVEMLALDAVEYPPTIWAVLSAREHLTRAQCRRHLRQLLIVARRRWPGIEWFVQVEFTTGLAPRSGGFRRLHLNLLIKGVPIDQAAELRELLTEVWCRRVDALPVGQWADVIEDGRGVIGYIAKMLAHGMKQEQAPPLGWKGHRTSQTKGYLVRPASVLRVEARRALRVKRLLHRGMDAIAAELEVDNGDAWKLHSLYPIPPAARWADTGRVVR